MASKYDLIVIGAGTFTTHLLLHSGYINFLAQLLTQWYMDRLAWPERSKGVH